LIVAEGATNLSDSVVAVRAGNTVTIQFDKQGYRTRRVDKVERIVRTTLPAVYGALADSLLAQYEVGYLLREKGALLTDIPTRGVRLPLSTGWRLALWPEMREGHDGGGLLVVAYRATVERAGAAD
jgi:hypothetical protein